MQTILRKAVDDLARAIEGKFGHYLPPVITDDTPEDEAAEIRAEAEQKGLPVIRYKGVSMAEYEQREREDDPSKGE
jgi:hypothetical protein